MLVYKIMLLSVLTLCTMCEADQHIYVLGGSDPRNLPLGKVAMYTADSGNGSWASIKAMGTIRYGGRAAALGGFIYHVGGSGKCNILSRDDNKRTAITISK